VYQTISDYYFFICQSYDSTTARWKLSVVQQATQMLAKNLKTLYFQAKTKSESNLKMAHWVQARQFSKLQTPPQKGGGAL